MEPRWPRTIPGTAASPSPLPVNFVVKNGSKMRARVPLPLNLAGATILIGGKQAPLLFASDGRLNAVVPCGIAVNSAQQVIATLASAISVPQPLMIAAAAPAVFTQDGKQAIVVDVDPAGNSTLVDAAHPAVIGHALVIYCTGLGEVNAGCHRKRRALQPAFDYRESSDGDDRRGCRRCAVRRTDADRSRAIPGECGDPRQRDAR